MTRHPAARIVSLVLILGVVSCSSAPPTTATTPAASPAAAVVSFTPTTAPAVAASPSAAPTVAVAPTQAVVASPAVPAKAAASPTAASAKPAATAADNNKGITFGKPVVFTTLGTTSMVGVLVTNTTDQVKSFTAKATFKNGDTIAATAVGAVNDILPGQTRGVSLVSSEAIPAKYETVKVDVDTMLREVKSTTGSEIAAKVIFGKPSVKTVSSMTMVDVEVTNNDAAPHSFTAQMVFLKGDQLLGIAVGAVNDLGAGQTKTASLITTGSTSGYDKTLLAVETAVK